MSLLIHLWSVGIVFEEVIEELGDEDWDLFLSLKLIYGKLLFLNNEFDDTYFKENEHKWFANPFLTYIQENTETRLCRTNKIHRFLYIYAPPDDWNIPQVNRIDNWW